MEKTLFQNYPEGKRKEMLRDNADETAERGYMKRFTPEQLAEMKNKLSEVDIEANDIEAEKKDAVQVYKDRLKPLYEERTRLLGGLKNKAEHVVEPCYKFLSEDDRMAGFYNADGELIEARPFGPDELQRNIFQMNKKTGTND